jgi:hypothetical protein
MADMEKLPDVISALEDLAKQLSASARRLRKEKDLNRTQAAPELGEVDRSILELHHKIGHLLGEQGPTVPLSAPPDGEIGLDELTSLLYRTINPPESRRNYTYTPPFAIEKVLRAYLRWITGPGKGVNVRQEA